MVLLVEPGVDVESLGDEPHQVPVLRKEARIMEHSCLTVVLAVAVGVAVVIPEKDNEVKYEVVDTDKVVQDFDNQFIVPSNICLCTVLKMALFENNNSSNQSKER